MTKFEFRVYYMDTQDSTQAWNSTNKIFEAHRFMCSAMPRAKIQTCVTTEESFPQMAQ